MPCGNARQRIDLPDGTILDVGAIADGEMVVRDGDELVGQAVPGGLSDGDKGDVVVSGGGSVWSLDSGVVDTAELAADGVTNAKLANMAQATIKGRASGAGTGDPADLTSADVSTILGLGTAATKNVGTAAGTVAAGDDARFLGTGHVAPRAAVKATNQTAIGTAFADITDLGFAVTSGKTYRFHYYLIMQSDAGTTGIDVAVSGPTTTILEYTVRFWGGVNTEGARAYNAYDGAVPQLASNGATPRIYEVLGIIKPSAGGTLIPRARREAVGSGPDCLAGSNGLIWQLD